ncbi:transmembrane protein 53-B-like [Babylonia areolata]|uniref:transmembrane protein 53-B-like n=1 Tax=Babylonia areolata TaxID=304850 RepID=UPI003FD4FD07
MAATLCRRGLKETAAWICWKHSQVLPVTATAQQRCLASSHHHLHSSSSSSSSLSHTDNKRIVTTTNIEGFELSSLGPPGNPHPRPVVVLIGWLNAKRQHLRKYQEVYWGKGFDVLTMRVSPIHIVRPKMGIKYTARLLNVLQENKELSHRQVVVHGFSIGAFIYTQLQLMLQRQHQRETVHPGSLGQLLQLDPPPSSSSSSSSYDLSSRIAGLVLDSPAYIDHMCHGIANSMTTNPAARALISNTLLLYLAAFPKSVTFHYQESHRMFHDNSVPTLILYSPIDLISSAIVSERYVEEWREKGFPAFTCKFPNSSHVSHFRNYPDQYLTALSSFLQQLELQAPKVVELDEAEEAAVAAAAAASAPEVQQLQAKVP